MLRMIFAVTIALLLATAANCQVGKAPDQPEAPREREVSDRGPPADVPRETVERAIEEAVRLLQNNRTTENQWPLLPQFPGAVTSHVVLGLLAAGVPVDDPSVREPLAYLRTIEPERCYQAALQTRVFCLAEPEKDLLLIRRNVAFLENQQIRTNKEMDGSWNYGSAVRSNVAGDNSNTQYVLEALYEAERIGVPTSETVWRRARDYWIRAQNADGSWGYTPGDKGYGSMTCAGISSLVMVDEKLGTGDVTIRDDRIRCCEQGTENKAVENGLKWLGDNFSVSRNPGDGSHLLYYLCGVERVGRLTHRRSFGGVDWYRAGANFLVERQDRLRGSWKGTGPGESNEVIGTAMALMFLGKGRRPVLATKFRFEADDAWQRHRRDLDRLTDYCSKRWKQELTWQAVDRQGAKPGDLNAAPVLFLSGSTVREFDDADVKLLRDYIDQGGFVFAENCCNGNEFDASFRAFLERVFPEREGAGKPKHPLRELPPDHAIYTAEEPFDLSKLKMVPEGIEFGGRTCLVYYPADLGCYWELDKAGRTARYPQGVEDAVRAHRALGINVMTYATQRKLKNKLDLPLEKLPDAKQG